jgi:tetratricopeptide (TPR) repeat protein
VLRRIGADETLEAELLYAESDVLWEAGRYDEYLAVTTRLVALRERIFGPTHPFTGRAHAALGVGIGTQGDFGRALAELDLGVKTLESSLGPDHPDLGDPLNDLGRTLSLAGRHDEAIVVLRQAIALGERALGADHPSVAISKTNLGRVLRRTGRCSEAMPLFDDSVRIYEKSFSPSYEGLLYPLIEIGVCQIDLGHPKQALGPLERALALEDRPEGIQPEKVAETKYALARALWDAGDAKNRDRARSLAVVARDVFASIRAAFARGPQAEVEAWIARNAPAK